jgi:hypothetical protein
MPDQFLNYLQQERRRLECELERARTLGPDRVEIARLDQLRAIVDDQLARWSADLGTERLAA